MTTQTVTIHVQTAGAMAIPNARVSLHRVVWGDNTIPYGSATTDASGNASFSAALDGGYVARVSLDGWRFSPTSVLVAATGAPQTFNVTGTDLAVANPTAPAKCRLFGFVAGETEDRRDVFVEEAVDGPAGVLLGTGGTGVDPTNIRVPSSVRTTFVRSGRWEIETTVGSTVRVRIPWANWEKVVLIPNQATANVADLRGVVGPTRLGFVGDTQITSTVGGKF